MKSNLLVVGIVIASVLSGCSNTSVTDNYVKVAGAKFERNQDGEVVLTRNEVELLKNNKDVVIVARTLPDGGVAMTPEEFDVLAQDEKLFLETVEQKNSSGIFPFTFLVKKGSLKENLSRLSKKYSNKETQFSLEYVGVDYYVEEAEVIRGDSVESLAGQILESFPVFTSVTEK